MRRAGEIKKRPPSDKQLVQFRETLESLQGRARTGRINKLLSDKHIKRAQVEWEAKHGDTTDDSYDAFADAFAAA